MGPRRKAADDAQCFQKPLSDGVGFAAGEPAWAWRAVETLDRHDIGHAESGEGISHIAFPDEAAHVGILRRERLDRFTLAALRIGEVIAQERSGDLNFDRPDKRSWRQALTGTWLEREHRIITGRSGIEEIDR